MEPIFKKLFIFSGVITFVCGSQPITNRDIMSARIETCGGCKVDRLPELKRFFDNDVMMFHNVKKVHVHGVNPDLLLLNKDGQIVERIDLTPLTQKQCNMLLVKKGFYKKQTIMSEVPDKYIDGPYGERQIPKFQIDIDDDQELYFNQAADAKQKDEL